LSGTYDIGSATVTTLALAHIKGLPIVIIGPQAVAERGVVQGGIVVSANSTIKGAKDLEGKTFAVSGPRNHRRVCAARVGRQERRRFIDDEI
jgi:ABC-type nitrate/sulfonate/bicarbonate transport system substrate-binding protein